MLALPGCAKWGFVEGGRRGRPKDYEHGVQVNGATHFLYQAQLEFAYMMLQWHRYSGRHYSYDRGRHGPRYGYRHGNYRHYYGGYWYAYPWWLGAAAIAAPYYADSYYYDDAEPDYAGGGHVQWCLDRYRSYNPRTDTFRGYDGLDHRCISPYSY